MARPPLFLLLALAACSCAPDPARDHEPPTTGEERATVAPRGEPGVTMRSGAEVPVKLPPGFRPYPNAEIVQNTVVTRKGRERSLLVFTSTDTPATIAAFYREEAKAAGASLSLDVTGKDGASLAGTIPHGGTFALTVTGGSPNRAELSFE